MASPADNTSQPALAARRDRPAAAEPDEGDVDITVVDGEAGRRLAVLQAQAILDVLTWFHEHTTADSDELDLAE
jgi:hypothetical protein